MENKKNDNYLKAQYHSSATINIDGKSYTLTQIKDKNWNVTYSSITPKIFGIF